MKFSIITVSYNSANTIMQTINSVDDQTLNEWEHIIIDGLSNDETPQLVYSALHSRRKFISEKDRGIYDAMNKGIALADGDIIAILNSDDLFATNDVLQNVQDVFAETDCDIVYSGIDYIDSSGRSITRWIPKRFIKGSYRNGFHTPHPGFFARRVVYQKLGNFDIDLSIAADFDLMRRFMESDHFQSVLLPATTVKMRADGTSSKFWNVLQGLNNIRQSFEKNDESLNLIVYFVRRYFPKLGRKIRTIVREVFE